jgi:hypothetical protein
MPKSMQMSAMLLPLSTMLKIISSGISLRKATSFLRFGVPAMLRPALKLF